MHNQREYFILLLSRTVEQIINILPWKWDSALSLDPTQGPLKLIIADRIHQVYPWHLKIRNRGKQVKMMIWDPPLHNSIQLIIIVVENIFPIKFISRPRSMSCVQKRIHCRHRNFFSDFLGKFAPWQQLIVLTSDRLRVREKKFIRFQQKRKHIKPTISCNTQPVCILVADIICNRFHHLQTFQMAII